MLPHVSLLIATHARISWLEEALFCAVHQQYRGRLEIVIVNDCPRQELICNHPSVRVVNTSGFPTLGAKRNAMVSEAAGQYVAWLDDDDLALPWYVERLVGGLSRSARAVISRNCFHIQGEIWARSAVAIEVLCERTHALAVGGYPLERDSGEDQIFRERLEEAGGAVTITDEPGAYVYRWAQGVYHISGRGTDLDGESFRRDAEWRMDNGSEPCGRVELKAGLRRDYFAGAPDEVLRRLPQSFRV